VTITAKFGTSNSLTRDFPAGTTVGALIGDANLQAALGHSSSVQAYVNGQAVSPDYVLQAGNEVSFEDRAGRKA